MSEKQKEIYASILKMFLDKLEERMEEKYDEAEKYDEVDEDDGTRSYHKMTKEQIMPDILYEFIDLGGDIDPDCYDFFEWCCDEIYRIGCKDNNEYRNLERKLDN